MMMNGKICKKKGKLSSFHESSAIIRTDREISRSVLFTSGMRIESGTS
jgi:hypothetical protein